MKTKNINNIEEWRPIKICNNMYEASSVGRIRSVTRNILLKNGNTQTHQGKNISMHINTQGYYMVILYINKKRKTFLVHKLIANAFLNHTPCGYKEVVDHINNNPLDNRVENLQLTTVRHNSSKDRYNQNNMTGVYKDNRNNRYYSQALINGNKKHLGYFETKEEARDIYLKTIKNL